MIQIIKLGLLLLKDILILPFHVIYTQDYIKLRKNRAPICDHNNVFVCIHEWGGYPMIRTKHVSSDIVPFVCGLQYQLERFSTYNGRYSINITVTMSDSHLCRNLNTIQDLCSTLLLVSNKGMDFSGYATFFNQIKDLPNSYVILSNSSVNAMQSDFLDSYIAYMEDNTDVGMLGVSCNSKCYQTLVRNNFTPHLQSFFLLTTINVLQEVVAVNNNSFPGLGITNKQLLIRDGEIKLSQLVLKLGYNLTVVTDSGPVKFNANKKEWVLPLGDYRCYTKFPNAIYPITNR